MALKHKRFRVEKEIGPKRWSRWVQPKMKGYHLSCCDCRLVHELQFRVVEDPQGKMVVQFRARRAPRYTAQERRKLKRTAC